MNYFNTLITLFLLWNNIPTEIKIEEKERQCIAEAINISKIYSDSIWKDFSKTPFTLLLVTNDYEFLINHPNPTEDFTFLKYDDLLKSKIYYRETQFNKSFLATFPAINGVNCIVVGTPENTNRNTTEWIITLLHEHFHQYVYNSHNYYNTVNKLDLANGDTTGMWMLNYPFPYDDETVSNTFKAYTVSLKQLSSIENINTLNFKRNYKLHLENRLKFKESISDSDYKYFSFQLWQEGIARYTEIKFLEAMNNYKATVAVKNLDDFIDFNLYKKRMLNTELNKLETFQLKEQKRVCFYAIGMAEGLLLDKLNTSWRSNYLKEKFFLEKYH
jgi:hypothetical protein